jgi:hypothetical protein
MPTLPTVEQTVTAPERPTLVALDTLLELATRSLLAENPALMPKPYPRSTQTNDPRLALAAAALTLAGTLRKVISAYLAHLDRICCDGQPLEEDDDIPF